MLTLFDASPKLSGFRCICSSLLTEIITNYIYYTVHVAICTCSICTSATRKRPSAQVEKGNHHKCR